MQQHINMEGLFGTRLKLGVSKMNKTNYLSILPELWYRKSINMSQYVAFIILTTSMRFPFREGNILREIY